MVVVRPVDALLLCLEQPVCRNQVRVPGNEIFAGRHGGISPLHHSISGMSNAQPLHNPAGKDFVVRLLLNGARSAFQQISPPILDRPLFPQPAIGGIVWRNKIEYPTHLLAKKQITNILRKRVVKKINFLPG